MFRSFIRLKKASVERRDQIRWFQWSWIFLAHVCCWRWSFLTRMCSSWFFSNGVYSNRVLIEITWNPPLSSIRYDHHQYLLRTPQGGYCTYIGCWLWYGLSVTWCRGRWDWGSCLHPDPWHLGVFETPCRIWLEFPPYILSQMPLMDVIRWVGRQKYPFFFGAEGAVLSRGLRTVSFQGE